MAENTDQYKSCYQNWMTLQQQDLDELLNALSAQPYNHSYLQFLTEKTITHFQEYNENRAKLAELDASVFFSPSWCTSFENTLLWFGGCRPSLLIRLVYSLTGSECEAQLSTFLQGERNGNMGNISSNQLNLINSLHCKILNEEDKLSTRMASLQEDVADEPLSLGGIGESSRVVDHIIEAHVVGLGVILSDADNLRLNTLKKLMGMLTPLQCVQVLVALNKLQLSIHQWGKQRESMARRTLE